VVMKRWDPVRDLLTLQEKMNRLFEESLSRGRPQEPALDSRGWSPLADAYEAPDGFVVMVEMAGLSEEDVELQVEADQLVVRGERGSRTGRGPIPGWPPSHRAQEGFPQRDMAGAARKL
jgi:HSP20 family protein